MLYSSITHWVTYMKRVDEFKAGDVIGFSGRSWDSVLINLATGGIPLWGLSHVGIVGYGKHRPELLLFESLGNGVTSSPVEEAVEKYKGRVWAYRLFRHMYLHEVTRMSAYLSSMIRRSYDVHGATRSAGKVFSFVEALFRKEDLTTLFCSELVAAQLAYVGLFATGSASRWNPNHLVRTLRQLGIVRRPERMK